MNDFKMTINGNVGKQEINKGQTESLSIELGHGDKLVTDIYDDENGLWAGIAISHGECPVGEFINTGADRVSDLSPLVTITTANPKSLDVLIAACERAKKHFKPVDKMGSEDLKDGEFYHVGFTEYLHGYIQGKAKYVASTNQLELTTRHGIYSLYPSEVEFIGNKHE